MCVKRITKNDAKRRENEQIKLIKTIKMITSENMKQQNQQSFNETLLYLLNLHKNDTHIHVHEHS